MKFAILATLAAAAATAVSGARLEARQNTEVCVAPSACSLAGTITIQGVTAPLPSMDAACCAGTTCTAVRPVNDLLDLAGLLGGVVGLLELILGLGGLADIPGLADLIALIEGLLAALPASVTGALVNSLGTVSAQASVSYRCSLNEIRTELLW